MKQRLIALFASLAVPALALAHHSGAMYDSTKSVTVEGTITEFKWMNPHSYFFMDVTDSHGVVANWKFEGFPPNVLYRTGWKRDVTLRPGDTITVFGWQARDGTNWAHSREVTFKDGKMISRRGSTTVNVYTFRINNKSNLATVDFEGVEGSDKGRKQPGIYQLKDDELKQSFAKFGLTPRGTSLQEGAALTKSEYEKWKKVIEDGHIASE